MQLSRKTSLLVGGAFIAAPSFARADAPTLNIGMNTNEITAQAYYAQEAGIFKKNGLNVVLEKLPGGNAVASAIVGVAAGERAVHRNSAGRRAAGTRARTHRGESVVEGTQWSLANQGRAVELLSDWTKMKVDKLRQPM